MRPGLFAFERTWSDAAFDAMYPDPPDVAEPGRPLLARGIRWFDPGASFATMLAELPLEQSMGLRVALWIVALAPLFTIRRLATIASLPQADRARVLERLLVSRVYAVRQLIAGFKAVGSLFYSQAAAVRAQMLTPLVRSDDLVTLRLKSKPSKRAPEERNEHEHAAE